MKTKARREQKTSIEEKRFTATVTGKEKLKEGYFKIYLDDGTKKIWKDGDGHYMLADRPYSFTQKFYNHRGQVIVRILNVEREYHSFG